MEEEVGCAMEGSRIKMEKHLKILSKKLALWLTRTFKPIMTHDELEPIMATLGFVGLPPSSSNAALPWKEYAYTAGAGCWRSNSEAPPPPPRPRLPYPRIDGLHVYTYRAFLDSLNFYLHLPDISDLFHIRGMQLHQIHDQRRKWREIVDAFYIFVYREGTLDQATFNLYHFDENSSNNNSGNGCTTSIVIRNKGNNTPATCIVSLNDIV